LSFCLPPKLVSKKLYLFAEVQTGIISAISVV
jgi:hypothetical protein